MYKKNIDLADILARTISEKPETLNRVHNALLYYSNQSEWNKFGKEMDDLGVTPDQLRQMVTLMKNLSK